MIAHSSFAINRLLVAVGYPPRQWNVVAVEVVIDWNGPCVVRVARTTGTSEVWEERELVDGDGQPLASWKRSVLTRQLLGQMYECCQRMVVSVRMGDAQRVVVETLATDNQIGRLADRLAEYEPAVPVIPLVPAVPDSRCAICRDPNCDEPNGKH